MEAGEVTGDFAQSFPTLGAVGDFGEVVEVFSHFGEDEAGEVFEKVFGPFVPFQFFALLVHLLEAFLPVPVAEPILIAAVPPFGEVLLGNGFANEKLSKDFFGLGQFVEPAQQGGSDFAVEQTLI